VGGSTSVWCVLVLGACPVSPAEGGAFSAGRSSIARSSVGAAQRCGEGGALGIPCGCGPNGPNKPRGKRIAHLAETPFAFCTSAFLPITPQTPKHLGFGVFMPSKLRRDTLFGLKMPTSWRNEEKKKNFCTSDFRFNGIFIFRWS
jgi:hypothetical protein